MNNTTLQSDSLLDLGRTYYKLTFNEQTRTTTTKKKYSTTKLNII